MSGRKSPSPTGHPTNHSNEPNLKTKLFSFLCSQFLLSTLLLGNAPWYLDLNLSHDWFFSHLMRHRFLANSSLESFHMSFLCFSCCYHHNWVPLSVSWIALLVSLWTGHPTNTHSSLSFCIWVYTAPRWEDILVFIPNELYMHPTPQPNKSLPTQPFPLYAFACCSLHMKYFYLSKSYAPFKPILNFKVSQNFSVLPPLDPFHFVPLDDSCHLLHVLIVCIPLLVF